MREAITDQIRSDIGDDLGTFAAKCFWVGFTCGAVLIAAVAVLAALVLT